MKRWQTIAAVFVASPLSDAAAAQEAQVPIVWRGTLSRQPAPNEDLIITTPAGGNRRLALRSRGGAPAALPPLPVAANLLGEASATAFGADGRCTVRSTPGEIHVACQAGAAIGGAVLNFGPFRLPRGTEFQLKLTGRGSRGFRGELTSKGADASQLLPVEPGRTLLPVREIGERGEPQLVIVAPAQGGELVLTEAELLPSAAAARTLETSAWIWAPEKWRHDPSALLDAAKARGLKRLFVSLNIQADNVVYDKELRLFLVMAGAADIDVEAVEGDPDMVLPQGLEAAMMRARAIAAYQRSAREGERLAGVQYDIEPYTLGGWGEHPISYTGWADAVLQLSAALGEKIDLVLPFWVSGEDGGVQFLQAVAPALRAVTVMSYRTQAPLLTQVAEPLLAWGTANGVKVRLALEAGPLADETEEIFRPADTGRLAVMPGARPRVYLLSRSGAVDDARMFDRHHRVVVQAQRLSFLGNEKAMTGLARATSPVFSAWPSFDGFALHGLDWESARSP